ncbi:hypothetical protein [Acidovorax sp. SDU_ACID1]|uniref:hypothetical protein n=1 Tax=Acidovorax sp. SDU_ACID1 TaxID=3136632 RepID=UPI0038734BF4
MPVSAGGAAPALFNIASLKDEVIVAVNDASAPRAEASAVGQALADKGTAYAVAVHHEQGE